MQLKGKRIINHRLGENSKITVFNSTDSKLTCLADKTKMMDFCLTYKTKIVIFCLAYKTKITYNCFNKGRNHYEQRSIKANND